MVYSTSQGTWTSTLMEDLYKQDVYLGLMPTQEVNKLLLSINLPKVNNISNNYFCIQDFAVTVELPSIFYTALGNHFCSLLLIVLLQRSVIKKEPRRIRLMIFNIFDLDDEYVSCRYLVIWEKRPGITGMDNPEACSTTT